MTREEEMSMNHTNGHPINGHPRGSGRDVEEKDEQTDENIFLFVPNLIGVLCPNHQPVTVVLTMYVMQAMHGSSSQSHPSTSCPSIHDAAASSTPSPVCSTHLTDSRHGSLDRARDSAQYWTW